MIAPAITITPIDRTRRIVAIAAPNGQSKAMPNWLQISRPKVKPLTPPTICGVTKSPTILVFDSGLGGLSVLREVVAARPDAHYVYVADDAFFPYGHHSEDEIIARVVPLIGELIDRHLPDLVVIACNTASTLVMSYLRAAYKIPFVGTVPAIKPACARSA